MLEIMIKTKNEQQKRIIGEKIHDSLVGSPAYLSAEVLLNYTDDGLPNDELLLLVGNDNQSNVSLTLEIRED